MKRRKWESKQKALIVLQGLKGKPIAEVCSEHQISQAQYYQWRDQFLANMEKAFEVARQSDREARLERQNERLKNLVGELTLELKKATRCCHEAAIIAGRSQEERADIGTDSGDQVGASVLGIPEGMCLFEVCGWTRGEPKADFETDAGALLVGEAKSSAQSKPDAVSSEATSDASESMVGD